MSRKSFAAEFLQFLNMLPSAESLDDPAVLPHESAPEHADYFLFQRSMIAELKSLETDPSVKIDGVIERYRSHPAYPLFHGQRSLSAVLEHLPLDVRQSIREEVFHVTTRAISNCCEKANRQIRTTRNHFSLPDAAGVVFILNDDIAILSPDVMAARVHQQLHKRLPSGDDRFPDIAFACVITWAHFVRGADGTPAQVQTPVRRRGRQVQCK